MPLTSANTASAVENPHLPRWERVAALAFLLLILAMKLRYLDALPVNTDEPQHLHVAWEWTQGKVQYRDFFDNHTPLFHLLTAPLVAWIGERSDIVLWMRVAMLPLYAICLACIYRLGMRLYSRRVAVWGTLIGATYPVFFVTSSQFRTDVLWMTAWFATLTVALTGRFTRGRVFVVGLLLGTTFAVSMKTSLLLISLVAAYGTVVWFLPKEERRKLLARSPAMALAALCGLCVVPLAIIGFFASEHALKEFIDCVITHNALPWPRGWHTVFLQRVLFPVLLPVVVWMGRAVFRAEADRALGVRRALLVMTSALYLLFLNCFWPMVTKQDFLPVVPLVALAIMPLLFGSERWLGKAARFLPVVLVVAQLTMVVRSRNPISDGDASSQQLVADILRLTNPGDFVMDAKGETVFRQRPFYYVLENITKRRIETGLLKDTIAADMRDDKHPTDRHPTYVTLLTRLPDKSMEWVQRYYVPVTLKISVAGCNLPDASSSQPRPFELGIGANYTVVSAHGPVQGTMDGASCSGSVFLAPGPHTFTCAESGSLAVIWTQAVERGFCPLAKGQ